MENQIIRERLRRLREGMRRNRIDYYFIPTADFHNSEYVCDFFKVREYYSGFNGSNGTLLVWQEGAGLWTDGRYFVQADKQLEGTGITLYRMYQPNVPTVEEFLTEQMQPGQYLGFDGRVVAACTGTELERKLSSKGIHLKYADDLAGELWEDRPPLSAGKIRVLEERICGLSCEEKLGQVRGSLQRFGAQGLVLTKLDDIMWLFNIRGCDVQCNPVALSYAYISMEEAFLFLRKEGLTDEVTAYLHEKQIRLKEYEEITDFLREKRTDGAVLADKRYCSYMLYKVLEEKGSVIDEKNPTELLKAVKNPVELSNMREIFLKDSVAVTRFIYWLKNNIGKQEITELTASDYLESLRREIPEFLDLSFPTISAYKENAAMMHYEATLESHAVLKKEGMLLVDSGGQYMGGTTDITRTIVLGAVSREEKKHYTLAAAGLLQMTHAKWLYGCSGRNLDILARQPLWDIDIDYQCGTGHGVGYILNVHEGPQSLRWRFAQGMSEAVLEEGMDVTNEPGVYIPGSHGIRIENVMVVKKGVANEYGQFMHFETLTYAPIDLEAIEPGYLSDTQRGWLNEYHEEVYKKISPFLTQQEQEWLREVTKPV